MRNLAGGFVRKGERADAGGIVLQILDQETNPLDEAVRFAGAGTGEHEQWSGRRLDRVALRA
jgi:hypothetical protein